MRFSIGDKLYNSATLNDVTVSQWLHFEIETERFGRKLGVQDALAMVSDLESLKPAERNSHSEILWITAISVWAARVAAGDPVTFEEAIEFPMGDLTMLPDPQDHREPANPTKARPRKGSGQGGRSRPTPRNAATSAAASISA